MLPSLLGIGLPVREIPAGNRHETIDFGTHIPIDNVHIFLVGRSE
jgi:hypothetical protein